MPSNHFIFKRATSDNELRQHVIVKDDTLIVGYALVMLRSFKYKIPVLTSMFEAADEVLSTKNYVAMGQICIAQPYRKKGLFKKIYNYYRTELESDFDCLVTEVATSNTRSLGAHKSVGFKVIKTKINDGVSWELMNWDWN